MIKRYNQFIKDKVNEEFIMADPAVKPSTPEVLPTTPNTRPQVEPRPTPPSIIPDERQSPVPAPAKAELPEEEGGEYMGQKYMSQLADMLGVNLESDGSIIYNGEKINFFSETEKFHIGKNKFSTPEEVISHLEQIAPKMSPEEENEMTGEIQGERNVGLDDIDEDEFEKGDMPFESKSYKSTRKFKRK